MKVKQRRWNGEATSEVTARETEHRKIAKLAAEEGFVLLKNEGDLLPLKPGSALGLYGAGAVKTIKGGTGSGDVNERESVTIRQGLTAAGFMITSEDWLDSYENIYAQARQEWKERVLKKVEEMGGNFFSGYSTTPFYMPAGDPVNEEKAAADGADTAIYVLSRIAGENADRKVMEGDYLISQEEKAILRQLCACYAHVVLVINTGGLIDLGFTEELPGIQVILQFVQAGQEGGSALADILTGEAVPSGKLVDSWALAYEDYPNAATFSHCNNDVDTEEYIEGIYVGYRYFDTFEKPVRYGFGYGLSYTQFSVELCGVQWISGKQPGIQVTVEVRNIGSRYSGKEVVQIYASCPQTKLPKEFRRLVAFGKTDKLAPGESQKLKLTFRAEALSSYQEQTASWVLESGKYGLWVGNSLEGARLSAVLELNQDAVLTECVNICPLQQKLEEMEPARQNILEREKAWQEQAKQENLPVMQIPAEELPTRKVTYRDLTMPLTGEAGRIVETLSEEQLIAMATGDPGKGQGNMLGSAGITIPGAAAETSRAAAKEPWNLESIALADGPAGLRLNQTYQIEAGKIIPQNFFNAFERGFFSNHKETRGTTRYQYCTAIPVGTLLAQSWNLPLIEQVGEMIGREMELFQVTLWLAPGMNIHRNPLCGRNFEYYSEDPLIAGMMASAMTRGVQSIPGCGTTVKHFACNNQEDNRMGSDTVISERALREIYLKGFEIAVRDAQPMSIMTSYNMINGVHAANCYDICTKAARDEWGFAGAIMTDWTTTTSSPRGECMASGCMRAGNDMVMPGSQRDHENLRQELAAGTLDIRALRRCVWNTARIILASNRYEEAESYLKQFEGLGEFMSAVSGD